MLFVDDYLLHIAADELLDLGKIAVCDVGSELRKQLSQSVLCDGCFFVLRPHLKQLLRKAQLLLLQLLQLADQRGVGNTAGYRVDDVRGPAKL